LNAAEKEVFHVNLYMKGSKAVELVMSSRSGATTSRWRPMVAVTTEMEKKEVQMKL
jgi:hypothetical protein